MVERELKGAVLVFTMFLMLIGVEGKDYCYYEEDPDWWRLRLYLRRN